MHSPSPDSSTSSSYDWEFLFNRKIHGEESSPEAMLLQERKENARLLQRLEQAERKDAEKSERIQELRQQLQDCRLQLRSESRSSWNLLRKIKQQLEAENARLMESLKRGGDVGQKRGVEEAGDGDGGADAVGKGKRKGASTECEDVAGRGECEVSAEAQGRRHSDSTDVRNDGSTKREIQRSTH